MPQLCETDGVTEDQTGILQAVRQFVDDQVIPVVKELGHANEVVENAFRIHGGHGYFKEREIERLMRGVRFMLIGEGTSDIQKMIIGRSLLEDYEFDA